MRFMDYIACCFGCVGVIGFLLARNMLREASEPPITVELFILVDSGIGEDLRVEWFEDEFGCMFDPVEVDRFQDLQAGMRGPLEAND